MRLPALILLLALGACAAEDEGAFRLVTIETGERAGLTLRELPRATLASIGLRYGLAVVQPGAAAQSAGLRPGDVVYGINHRPIHSLHDLADALAQPAGGHVLLLVRRGKRDLYLAVELGAARGPRTPATDTLLRT